MSHQWPGGLIRKTPPTPTGPYQDSSASGVWTLDQVAYWEQQNNWPTAGSVNPSLFIENLFQTWLYTGNGTSQTITNGIDLSTSGGLVWVKNRSGAYTHVLVDTVRGTDKVLCSNNTNAEQTGDPGFVTQFNANGFAIGDQARVNLSSSNFASWTFRKQPKFFDIVTYTGTGSARTVAHNLGSVPGCIIVKQTSASGQGWPVYHRSEGNGRALLLNDTAASFLASGYWSNTTPTSTQFTLGSSAAVNENGQTYVAYIFAHDAGGFGLTGTDNVISCGSFTTDSGGVASVTLGYEPQWVMTKNSSGTSAWRMFDTMRGMTTAGQNDALLQANSSAAEITNSDYCSPTATGFEIAGHDGSATHIYIAIRRGPMKTPTTGTSVFSPNLSATTTGTTVTTNFPLDLQIAGYRPGLSPNFGFSDRLRGVSSTSTEVANYLTSTNTAAESTALNFRTLAWSNTGYNQDGYLSGSGSGIYWNFRRAPGFFDVVCYTGTESNLTLNHNLGVTPELIITKRRNGATYGAVYASSLGVNQYLELFSSSSGGRSAAQTFSGSWLTPTSTTFGVGVTDQNLSAATYVAYLFSTVAGVSKVGSYTGNGSSQTINCGFTGGARFVLIKRTNAAGDWVVFDSARGIVSGNDPFLELNTTAAEQTGQDAVDTDSTGFVVNETTENLNVNGASYIFLAIA
jgi:hypothetical protein